MAISKKKSNTRFTLALSLFAAALIAAFAMTYTATPHEKYWVPVRSIPAGVIIESSDLELRPASLGSSKSRYLWQSQNPVGSIALRALAPGEFITQAQITEDSNQLRAREISLSIRSSDTPLDLRAGDIISMYWLHDLKNGETFTEPQKLLTGVFVSAVSQKGSNFGSDVLVAISIDINDVERVLTATTSGRIVLVRSDA